MSDKVIRKERKPVLSLLVFSLELSDPMEHKDIASSATASVIFLNRLFAKFIYHRELTLGFTTWPIYYIDVLKCYFKHVALGVTQFNCPPKL